MRIAEGLVFVSLAAGAHLGLWASAPSVFGAVSRGADGGAAMTVAAASPATAAMVAAWERPPEAQQTLQAARSVRETAPPKTEFPAEDAPVQRSYEPHRLAGPAIEPAPRNSLRSAALRPLPIPEPDNVPDPDPMATGDAAPPRPKSENPVRRDLPRALATAAPAPPMPLPPPSSPAPPARRSCGRRWRRRRRRRSSCRPGSG